MAEAAVVEAAPKTKTAGKAEAPAKPKKLKAWAIFPTLTIRNLIPEVSEDLVRGARMIHHVTQGERFVQFAGGEAMVPEDLVESLREAPQYGFQFCLCVDLKKMLKDRRNTAMGFLRQMERGSKLTAGQGETVVSAADRAQMLSEME